MNLNPANNLFSATSFEEMTLPSGHVVSIPKCRLVFKKWNGQPIKETFGRKPFIDVGGKGMFAELAVMHRFITAGWQARWIEAYGTGNKEPKCFSEWIDDKYKNQILDPIVDVTVADRLKSIAALNGGSYSGCWDVLGWSGEKMIFAESKQSKKDRIRVTQVRWLEAGLRSGLMPENFRIVQWDFEDECVPVAKGRNPGMLEGPGGFEPPT